MSDDWEDIERNNMNKKKEMQRDVIEHARRCQLLGRSSLKEQTGSLLYHQVLILHCIIWQRDCTKNFLSFRIYGAVDTHESGCVYSIADRDRLGHVGSLARASLKPTRTVQSSTMNVNELSSFQVIIMTSLRLEIQLQLPLLILTLSTVLSVS